MTEKRIVDGKPPRTDDGDTLVALASEPEQPQLDLDAQHVIDAGEIIKEYLSEKASEIFYGLFEKKCREFVADIAHAQLKFIPGFNINPFAWANEKLHWKDHSDYRRNLLTTNLKDLLTPDNLRRYLEIRHGEFAKQLDIYNNDQDLKMLSKLEGQDKELKELIEYSQFRELKAFRYIVPMCMSPELRSIPIIAVSRIEDFSDGGVNQVKGVNRSDIHHYIRLRTPSFEQIVSVAKDYEVTDVADIVKEIDAVAKDLKRWKKYTY